MPEKAVEGEGVEVQMEGRQKDQCPVSAPDN